MKDSTKVKIKKLIPNIPVVRKRFNENKLKRLRAKLLPEKDIVAGESNAGKKREIVQQYSEKWSKYTAILNKQLDEYFAHEPALMQRPDVEDLRVDVLFNAYAYGFEPDEYFFYYIEGKTREEKEEYISDLEKDILTYALNDVIDIEIFYDKARTYEKLKKYFKRDAISIERTADYKRFLRFIKKHPVFVRKSVGMGRGKGVSKVDSRGKDKKALFESLIKMGKQILEELVVQSPEMAKFNPTSVNTVRCPTFRTVRGIELAPCRFRIGQGGSFVDNAGSGGILAGIDPKTGIVFTSGRDEYCNEYITHPQTGLRFEGFQVPKWEELIAVVTEMHELFPNMGYISWDMALTDKGWVLIEANGSGQFIGTQIVEQKGKKRDIAKMLEGVYSF